jgi:hypothetical protein
MGKTDENIKFPVHHCCVCIKMLIIIKVKILVLDEALRVDHVWSKIAKGQLISE